MISPARKVSFDLLQRIVRGGSFSDAALNSEAVAGLGARDRHLTMEIVLGTLRWQLSLDYVLAGACSRPWERLDAEVQILLRMSLYQMWRMDRLPDHAVVDDAVELAKRTSKRSSSGFVNGVLRGLSRRRPWAGGSHEMDCPPWIRASLPKWLWDRWRLRFGEGIALQYALSINDPPRRAFRLIGQAPAPQGPGGECIPSDLVPHAFIGEAPGLFPPAHIQDEASQLIPHLLGPTPGWRVWDACAAPGGKSAILLENCGESGLVVSSDLSPNRALRMAATFASRGMPRSHIVLADASVSSPFRAEFDAVLADVPCSGLGTLRRNPEIKWRLDPERLAGLGCGQKRLLGAVAQSVRRGGLLLYSTCSTEPEENEDVVEAFLQEHSGFRLLRPSYPPGIASWLDARGILRTYPSARLWDGFFAALIVRNS